MGLLENLKLDVAYILVSLDRTEVVSGLGEKPLCVILLLFNLTSFCDKR
jgi:hypothetical protein